MPRGRAPASPDSSRCARRASEQAQESSGDRMPRRMTLPRPKVALVACLLMGLVVLAGCENTREHKAGREGLPEEVGNIEYNVYITRELNLRDVEDSGYYNGPEAPP